MYNDRGQQLSRFFTRNATPITVSMLALYVLCFFVTLAFPGVPIPKYILFSTRDWLPRFWTVFTWPIMPDGGGPISALFAIGWFYLFSSSLERSWGMRDYGLFLASMASLTALGMWVGSFLVGPGVAAGLWMISGSLAVAWSALNRGEMVNLFFLPVPAPMIGLLGAALVWYHGGASYGNPLLGLFALLSCAAAYWYVTKGRYSSSGFSLSRSGSSSRGSSRRDSGPSLRPDTAARFRNLERETVSPRGGWNPLRWWKERRERKRLEAIFRRSGFTDKD